MTQPSGAQQRRSCLGQTGCWLAPVLLVVLAYLGLRAAGALLITGNALEPADAVVVMGGGGEQRVAEAARLIKSGYGTWLVITEPDPSEGEERAGSAAYREVAILQGLSPDILLVTEKTALSTYQEALAVLHTMQQHGLSSVIIVTDPFHTLRTRLAFREVFTGSGLAARVHPVPDHWYRSSDWFLSVNGWRYTLREYASLAAFWLGVSTALE